MRAMVLAAALLASEAAQAQSFCAVSNSGRERCYHTADMCRQMARPDGFCVYRPDAGSGERRSYPSAFDAFEQGRRDSQERRLREAEIERQELENEALRQSLARPKPEPDAPPRIGRNGEPVPNAGELLSDPLRYAPQPGWYDEERVRMCEPVRREQREAMLRAAGNMETSAAAADHYYACLGPRLR